MAQNTNTDRQTQYILYTQVTHTVMHTHTQTRNSYIVGVAYP